MVDRFPTNPLHYIIVETHLGGDIELAERVNEQIAHGYEPIGGVAFQGMKAMQAMIKRREGADVQ